MLPSSGYFQNVVCPFFKSGLCERPHCHFKHSKTGTTGKPQSQWMTSVDDVEIVDEHTAKPDLFTVLNRTETNLGQIDIKPEALHAFLPSAQKYPVKPSGILKTTTIKQEKQVPVIPEYKPTPISQLMQLNPDVKPSLETLIPYDNTSGSRKRKKFEEYDPEEVKYSKKRVSFNLPEDDFMSDAVAESVITIESSDDDIDSTSAKFSDDDSDEEVQVCPPPRIEPKVEPIEETVTKLVPEEPKQEISEFSLVDKILVDVSRNEEFIRNFNKPVKVVRTEIADALGSVKNVCPKPSVMKPEDEPKTSKVQAVDSLDLPKEKFSTTSSKTDKSVCKPITEVSKEKSEKPTKEKTKKLESEEKTKKLESEEKTKKLESGEKKETLLKAVKKKSEEKFRTSDKEHKSSSIEKKVKTSHTEKPKSSSSKHSKDDKGRSIKEVKSVSKDVKEKVAKDKSKLPKDEKVKSSSDGRGKDYKTAPLKDSAIKTSSKDTHHKSSKSEVSKVVKLEKHSESKKSKESVGLKSKDSVDPKSKLPKDKSDKSKSSSSSSSSSSVKKLGDYKPKDSKFTIPKRKDCESKVKDTSSSSKSFPNKKQSTCVDKLPVQRKEPTKIQDEKISSSSVIKKDKNSDLKYVKCKPVSNKTVSPKSFRSKESGLFGEVTAGNVPNNSDSDVSNDEGDVHSDLDDVALDSSGSEMDSDTYEECWRIFNETNSTNSEEVKVHEESSPEPEAHRVSNMLVLGNKKKRLAHQTDFKRSGKKSPSKEKPNLNPAQVMHNRYLQLQEMYAKQNEKKESTSSFLSSLNKNNTDGQKKRVAVPPSSGLVALVAQKNKAMAGGDGSSSHTTVTTVKGAPRVAHVPNVAMSPRPIIPAVYGNKVATNIRQRYLNNFIDECLKFCLTEEQAYEMALEEEKRAYDRSTNKTIYLNVAANTLNRLRHRAREGPPAGVPDDVPVRPTVSSTTNPPDAAPKKTVSHETVLAGPRRFSYSIERRKNKAPEVQIRGVLLYNCLQEHLLTEEQLREHGFPLPHPTEVGRVEINSMYANKQPTCNDPFKRICSRCSKTYYVDDEGQYVKSEECVFHWGRIYKKRIAGSLESRYMCCQGDPESDGCCVGIGHVFEGSDSHLLKGFVKTLPKSPPPDNYYGVYSLDCEMCYTTAGIELTRVTVIGPDLNAVFETFVKPEHEVLDYNTRFSGITEDDLVGITTTIRDVQAILLCMFNEKTILIGHSLESDFKALKLIHKTVVDTSVVFPHKLGLPYKRALRTLMAEKCNKIIQNSIGGHDSHEDAAACMELMLWKIKEDMKYSSR